MAPNVPVCNRMPRQYGTLQDVVGSSSLLSIIYTIMILNHTTRSRHPAQRVDATLPTMGVPGFFKWITIKYPKVLIDCIEEEVVEMAGTRIPLKLTDPNPNGEEFDCLYIDMNGLVHPCCHPEGRPRPKT